MCQLTQFLSFCWNIFLVLWICWFYDTLWDSIDFTNIVLCVGICEELSQRSQVQTVVIIHNSCKLISEFYSNIYFIFVNMSKWFFCFFKLKCCILIYIVSSSIIKVWDFNQQWFLYLWFFLWVYLAYL